MTRIRQEDEQAARQSEGGEAVGFIPSSGLNNLKAGHPARIYPVGSMPSPFEASTLVYTAPQPDKPEGEIAVAALESVKRRIEDSHTAMAPSAKIAVQRVFEAIRLEIESRTPMFSAPPADKEKGDE